jgi:hypothetical protein
MANIHIKLVGSNIKPNDKGKEVISFIIAIGSLGHQDEFEEKWRVEKLYSDFLTLDSKLKAQRSNRSATARIGKLPDKALFSNNAPSKVDQRKVRKKPDQSSNSQKLIHYVGYRLPWSNIYSILWPYL